MKQSALVKHYTEFKESWDTLGFYERVEQVIALILTGLIAIIVVIATLDLAKQVYLLVVRGVPNPVDYRMFQATFGQIVTVFIALEFKHAILNVVANRESIIQVKTVLLIALLAIARSFIMLDVAKTSAESVFALAAVIVTLGVTYWLVRDRDARLAAR